jgi:UDP-hydrolysing UDP-N-acetyl-D-glucosamine 2-epimerase
MMRKILVVTSGRADATPLTPVINLLEKRCVLYRVDLEGKSLAGCIGATQYWLKDKPDIMLVLGDRYETLAAVLAGTVYKTPVAHIHGGEHTLASFDDQIRNAITKLAHIHFAATEDYAYRIEYGLGERHHVYCTGAPGLDSLTDLPPRRPEKYFVCTYHPETLGSDHLPALLEALDRFPDYKQIWTGVNNDPGSDRIVQLLGSRVCSNLSPRGFVLALRNAAAMVGNSSSGIIEAPTIGVPTVNVGFRQEGRLRGPSVLDCSGDLDDIIRTIQRALDYGGPYDNPYGKAGASQKIVDILMDVELDGILVKA